MRDDFAIFICTHGRPNEQHTLNKILNSGYTGKYYLVLDDQDDTIQSYIDNFGTSHIIVFDKNHYINNTDVGSRMPPYKCIVYAKNAVEDIAEDMRLSAFVIADDDVYSFRYRWPEGSVLKSKEINYDIDKVITAYVDAILSMGIITSSFGGGVHYFRGVDSLNADCLQNMRIPFQFVFRNASTKVKWLSVLGEDVITAAVHNSIGQLWQVLPQVEIGVMPVSGASGGMLSVYESTSSLERTMYNYIYLPSGIRIMCRKNVFKPSVRYDNCTPKILSESYKLRKE